RPHDAGNSVSKQISNRDLRVTVDAGEGLHLKSGSTEAIAAQVLPAGEFVLAEVDDVGGPRAIDIRQPQVRRVKGVRVVEHRDVVHTNLCPKSSVAQIGPI